MKTRIKAYITFFFVLLATVAKGQFVDIQWLPNDTVAPCFEKSYSLGADYMRWECSFSMEYVETMPATDEELERYNVDIESLDSDFDISTFLGVSRRKGSYDVSVYPFAIRNDKVVKLLSFKPVFSKSPKTLAERRSVLKTAESRYADSSLLAFGRWVKIQVKDEGVYELTKSKLLSLGFINPEKVRLYGYNLPVLKEVSIEHLPDDMKEIPLWRKSDGSVLFYSCGLTRWNRKNGSRIEFEHFNNPYSNYVSYFLSEEGKGEPLAFDVVDEKTASSVKTTTFPEHSLIETDAFSFINSGRTFYDNYDFADGNKRTFTLDLPGRASGDVTLNVRFAAAGKSASSLSVSIDDKTLGTMSFGSLPEYIYAIENNRTYRLTDINVDKLPVTLTHTRQNGVSGHLDYICASYERRLDLTGLNYLSFIPLYDINSTFVIDGATESTKVWRVTTPDVMCELRGGYSDGVYEASARSMGVVVNNERYVALNVNASFPTPEIVGVIENQNLHATGHYDLVIIVPSSGKLVGQAQRLADAHTAKEGMRCLVVTADKIYNEFSSGMPDATAYRRFMKMLYDRATGDSDVPKNLLLFGDGVWDNRMRTATMKDKKADDYLLCYESDNSVSHTNSFVLEEYFTLLDDGEGISPLKEKLDIGVGRIPVVTAVEAEEVVDKLVGYINNEEVGAWKNTICVLGDDGDANLHMDDAEEVLTSTQANYPEYHYRRIYWDAYTLENTSTGASFPGAYADINKQMEDGALIMNYTGHGAAYSLSHEKVLRRTDFEKWNSPRLPLWITAACDISPFDMNEANIGESALLNPKGAAMGVITTTRTVYSSQNRKINKSFMTNVLGKHENGRRITVGEALQLAKNDVVASIRTARDSLNKCHFVLLGDPAISLSLPTYKANVDAFGTSSGADSETPLISAGNVITVKGHIVDEDGNVATDFTGTVSPVVYDNIEHVICKNGADADIPSPMDYYERLKVLYAGQDSVRNGRFEFRFPVPLDINYSNESGLLKLYAVNTDHSIEANGDYDKFLVGGTMNGLMTDSVGPQISFYLNKESFVSGDKVNESPLLFATITDSDGINTTGSGVGHDLIAVVDNEETMTYNLNSYFVPKAGDYTQGTVAYKLPTLPVGKHTIMLQAWDILNNPTTKTLEFEVVEGLAPTVFSLTCNSPVRSTATFSLTVDRAYSEIKAKVVVYDMLGREVVVLDGSDDSRTNIYTYSWNLDMTDRHLQPGIYIAKAYITDENGGRTSKAVKFVVLGTSSAE